MYGLRSPGAGVNPPPQSASEKEKDPGFLLQKILHLPSEVCEVM